MSPQGGMQMVLTADILNLTCKYNWLLATGACGTLFALLEQITFCNFQRSTLNRSFSEKG